MGVRARLAVPGDRRRRVSGARFERLEALFHEALPRSPGERAALLETACRDDPTLRSEVERLLAAHDRAGGFIQVPAATLAAVAPPDEPMDGRRIGPYRVVRELGRGGMGAVYLAERADGQYEQRVALKLIKRGMDTEQVLARFRAERQILASLDHPNIARLLDGGTTETGVPYFAMEYVEGEPIDAYAEPARAGRRGAAPAVPPGVRRGDLRAPAPGRAPRHQAAQHPGDRGGRAEAARLRHRQGAPRQRRTRCTSTVTGHAPAHAGVRQPRAGRGPPPPPRATSTRSAWCSTSC